MHANRKASFKTPPTTITDKLVSQEARRCKALEVQKKKRAQRVDASRQLDFFADLNLGPSDDEVDNGADDHGAVQGVALFAPMLGSGSTSTQAEKPTAPTPEPKENKKRSRNKRKSRAARNDKPTKWADKCMYAELLEMNDDDAWSYGGTDGLPADLETGFVAVGPVPVGKRCLAVTHQSSGLGGVVPNTTLRSRVLGKSLLARFPSWLPPLTILDCILDSNWKDNGILHVLDVLQWKGQDVGDCETAFRFWWRDTRLAELPRSPPPPASAPLTSSPSPTIDSSAISNHYQFPYPTTFVAIPYHSDTSLAVLSAHIIPLARSSRSIPVDVPFNAQLASATDSGSTMDMDTAAASAGLASVHAQVGSDGLLLYVSQASYEPGTSPLSSWIPIVAYSTEDTQGIEHQEGPLDKFERLVNRRIAHGPSSNDREVEMDTE
ncbi:hypothetical protein PLICRDRAFT_33790 [Plicaturopsis crispa FD-325 SS-3]|nr:hypothetical protein PLICRDRAFT_33790 [Plicaturopsis crispa FD-325 SS-3]